MNKKTCVLISQHFFFKAFCIYVGLISISFFSCFLNFEGKGNKNWSFLLIGLDNFNRFCLHFFKLLNMDPNRRNVSIFCGNVFKKRTGEIGNFMIKCVF